MYSFLSSKKKKKDDHVFMITIAHWTLDKEFQSKQLFIAEVSHINHVRLHVRRNEEVIYKQNP